MYSPSLLTVLRNLYQTYDTTVDQLAISPDMLRRFTDQLNDHEHVAFSPNQTLQALFYARKTGRLPRLRRRIGKYSAPNQ
jgi:hypothetical protein